MSEATAFEFRTTRRSDKDREIFVFRPYGHAAAGHSRHIWDPEDEFETEQAKIMFDNYKRKGYVIYRVDDEGKRTETMKKFDPTAAKMIMQEPNVAG